MIFFDENGGFFWSSCSHCSVTVGCEVVEIDNYEVG